MKLMQVKFPTLREMVAFIRTNKVVLNDYNLGTDTLTIEDNDSNRHLIVYHRGKVLEMNIQENTIRQN